MRLRQTLTALGVATAVALPALVSAAQKPDPAKGKATFTRVGCAGCHSTDGHPKGNPPNPDLSHVGKKFSAAQIAGKINDPKKTNPNSTMPNAKALKLSPADVANVSAYLATMK